MLCGYPPFKGKSEKEIFEKAASGKIDFPKAEWDHISEAAKNLVKKMLTVDPKKRVSAADALNDAWIKSSVARATIDPEVAKTTLGRLKNFRVCFLINRQKLITFITGSQVKNCRMRPGCSW